MTRNDITKTDSKLISHEVSPPSFSQTLESVRARAQSLGNTAHSTVEERLALVEQMCEFELGRFLIANGGLNGRWSHYVFYLSQLPTTKPPAHPLERRLLGLWNWVSVRARNNIVWQHLQPELCDGMSLLSVPCGFMAELLALDYGGLNSVRIVGVDLDPESLDGARIFANERNLADRVKLLPGDAWNLKVNGDFDRVVCMGLSPYSATVEVAMDLYRSLFGKLKDGGKLLISFRSLSLNEDGCEQDLSTISQDEMRLQRTIFSEILQPKFNHRCSSQQMQERLLKVGFSKVDCVFGPYRVHNVAIATK